MIGMAALIVVAGLAKLNAENHYIENWMQTDQKSPSLVESVELRRNLAAVEMYQSNDNQNDSEESAEETYEKIMEQLGKLWKKSKGKLSEAMKQYKDMTPPAFLQDEGGEPFNLYPNGNSFDKIKDTF